MKQEDLMNEYIDGIEVEQVTDTNPGVLEVDETNANTYIINSIEDLVFFAYDVRQGNTYEEDIVKLGLSLDFSLTKSYVDPYRTDYGEYGYNGELKTLLTTGNGFIPIGGDGLAEKSFSGEFDGNNNAINNLYINQSITDGDEYQFIGLFKQNLGVIKNLNINGNINLNVTKNNVAVGFIAGLFSGNNANIENCCSSGKINIKGQSLSTDYYVAVGGNVGQVNSGGMVTRCCNKADIVVQCNRTFVGGLVGSCNTGALNKSYNTGSVEAIGEDEFLTRCGGIVGNSAAKDNIEYCYNIGNVQGYNLTGGIAGGASINNIMNCQYKNKDIDGIGGTETLEEDEIKNNIIRKEDLTEQEILTILKNMNTM